MARCVLMQTSWDALNISKIFSAPILAYTWDTLAPTPHPSHPQYTEYVRPSHYTYTLYPLKHTHQDKHAVAAAAFHLHPKMNIILLYSRTIHQTKPLFSGHTSSSDAGFAVYMYLCVCLCLCTTVCVSVS